jgi:glycyl-tRNA synthetase beta chain
VPEFLLEIGFEEMPAPWLEGLGGQLSQKLTEAAARDFLDPQDVLVQWTPRRLVARLTVVARQLDREEPVWGPSLKVAKDPSGAWTGAAHGFAKKNGVAVDDLRQGPKDPSKPSELSLLFVKKVAGRAAADVLPGVMASALRGLSFPKRMSWDAWLDDGKGAFAFGRPIRWLLATLDGTVIPFVVYELVDGAKGKARVASGPTTIGHRFLPKGAGGKAHIVRSHAELQDALRRSFVLLAPEERARKIADELARATRDVPLADDHGLPQEWRDLVEYPTVLEGEVPAEFRSLPREVLETVLVHHQKYIPLTARDGVVSRFAAVVNGDGEAGPAIVRGMERVVVARLRDAAFFYAEDGKKPLADRVADLAGVTFHQGLGSYEDKAERLVRLVGKMREVGLLGKEDAAAAAEGARLAKADLTTLMVREFPELQGTMGGLYLGREGAAPEVAKAVYWHYHPVVLREDALPAGVLEGRSKRTFAVVSLADKIDTLAGYFGLGLAPTGSSDPFGLRRAGQGAIRVALDFWEAGSGTKPLDLAALARDAVEGYPSAKRPPDEALNDLRSFLLDRLAYVLGSRGFPVEEVEATLGAPGMDALADPRDALVRLRALHDVRASSVQDFTHLAVAFKRAKNILTQQQASAAIEPTLFEHDAERELFQAVAAAGGGNGDYHARLRSLAGLREPVDRFFDDVLVMAEDPKVRGNRLALLNETLSLFYRIADISKLGGQS